MDGRSEGRTDRIDCVFVEVGQPVVSFGCRPLIFIAKASCDRQPLIGPPLVLKVHAKAMKAHSRIHHYGRPTTTCSKQHGGNRVASGETPLGSLVASLTRAATRYRLAGCEGPIEIKVTGLILAVVHESNVVVCAELQRMLRKLLRKISDECGVAPNIAIQTREIATQSRIGVYVYDGEHRYLKKRVRKTNRARVCFTIANRCLFFVPVSNGSITIDDPRRTGRVSVI